MFHRIETRVDSGVQFKDIKNCIYQSPLGKMNLGRYVADFAVLHFVVFVNCFMGSLDIDDLGWGVA